MASDSFGGASVTVPLKLDIIDVLRTQENDGPGQSKERDDTTPYLSPAAAALGAVNTIVRHPTEGILFGDNSDWIGIRDVILRGVRDHPLCDRISALGGDDDKSKEGLFMGGDSNVDNEFAPLLLVIGAGGTARAACYAARQLGLRLRIWNRTVSKAEALAPEFGGKVMVQTGQSSFRFIFCFVLYSSVVYAHFVSILPSVSTCVILTFSFWLLALDFVSLHLLVYFQAVEDLSSMKESVDIVVSTVPPEARFTLPDSILIRKGGNVPLIVLDAAYRPRETPLLTQADAAGAVTLRGIDMLLAQAVPQFEHWTGMEAPREAMDRAGRAFYMDTVPLK